MFIVISKYVRDIECANDKCDSHPCSYAYRYSYAVNVSCFSGLDIAKTKDGLFIVIATDQEERSIPLSVHKTKRRAEETIEHIFNGLTNNCVITRLEEDDEEDDEDEEE